MLSPDPSDTEPAVGLLGCFGPDYGPSYGRLIAGYSPYSYGWPVYAYGYTPTFVVHHPWEEHHANGHPGYFYHGPVGGPRVVGAHTGPFGMHVAWGTRGGHH